MHFLPCYLFRSTPRAFSTWGTL